MDIRIDTTLTNRHEDETQPIPRIVIIDLYEGEVFDAEGRPIGIVTNHNEGVEIERTFTSIGNHTPATCHARTVDLKITLLNRWK